MLSGLRLVRRLRSHTVSSSTPIRPGIPQIGFQRRPRGHAPAASSALRGSVSSTRSKPSIARMATFSACGFASAMLVSSLQNARRNGNRSPANYRQRAGSRVSDLGEPYCDKARAARLGAQPGRWQRRGVGHRGSARSRRDDRSLLERPACGPGRPSHCHACCGRWRRRFCRPPDRVAIRTATNRSRRPSCCSRGHSGADGRRNRRPAACWSGAPGRAMRGRNRRRHRRRRPRGSTR
jgi:hypothetical protein